MNGEPNNVFVVLHSVHSVYRVVETAQVVYGLGFPTLAISKAEGSAAQTGIPEANRLALKMKRSFMVLPDLPDVIEALGVDRPLMITSPMLTKERVDFNTLAQEVKSGQRVMIALCGTSSSFSRKEMDLGECRSLDAVVDIGPVGSAAVILYNVRSRLGEG
ncbi:MAG: exonuclease [Candidatus Thorarchaeota archaeon]|nr:exonuclease [Candidatus Thorarchaeota archaeon]